MSIKDAFLRLHLCGDSQWQHVMVKPALGPHQNENSHQAAEMAKDICHWADGLFFGQNKIHMNVTLGFGKKPSAFFNTF